MSTSSAPPADAPPLFGLVLVGGASRRMGTPKWALDYHGEPHAHRTARLLGAVCERVFLSVRPGPPDAGLPGAALPDLPTIPDAISLTGPSAGILSAMADHPGAAWLVAACDLPHLDAPTLAALVAGRDPGRVATAYRSASDGLPEPLCAVWEPHARESLLAAATAGAPCPRRFLVGADTALITLARPDALDNANTPGDQAAAQAALALQP